MDPFLKAVLSGVASGVAIDLTSFIGARSKDRTVSFDWQLFVARAFLGLIVGTGIGAVPGTPVLPVA